MAFVKRRSNFIYNALGVAQVGKTATLRNLADGSFVNTDTTDADGAYDFTGLDETLRYYVQVEPGGGSSLRHTDAVISGEADDFYINVSLRTAAAASVIFGGTVEAASTVTAAGTITSTGGVIRSEGTAPRSEWFETDASANEKNWRLGMSAGVFYLQAINDAGAGSAVAWQMERSGNTVTAMKWTNGASPFVTFNYATGAVTLTGAIAVGGASTLTGAVTASSTLAVTGAVTAASTVTSAATIKSTAGLFRSEGTAPIYDWQETDAAADAKNWRMGSSGGTIYVQSLSDAGAGSALAWAIDRVGTLPQTMRWYNNAGLPFATFNYTNSQILFSGVVAGGGVTTGTGTLGRYASGTYVGGGLEANAIITLAWVPETMTIWHPTQTQRWSLIRKGAFVMSILENDIPIHNTVTSGVYLTGNAAGVLKPGPPVNGFFPNQAGQTYYWFAWG